MRFCGYGDASVWRTMRPNVWDVAALILVFGALVLIVYGLEQTAAPLAPGRTTVSLDPAHLPYYALRTTLRMLAAIVCSTIFTLIYAAVAAKSRRAEIVLIPLLDILQSVPILGFLTFTVVFFLNLFPGRLLGAELACVFAIFTSQAWNMTFSLYQSLRTVPKDLAEAARAFHLSAWHRFWRLDLPFGMPGLVWNAMMSMSGGWFFVVALEAISVGSTTIMLPGIGSYMALAIERKDLAAIVYAIVAMLLVIVAYDQLLFRPIVAWADKFRFEQTASAETPSSWVLDLFRRTRALRAIVRPFAVIKRRIADLRLPLPAPLFSSGADERISRPVDALWIAFVAAMTVYAACLTYRYLSATLGPNDVMLAFREGLVTLVRVAILIVLATLVWVPIGVWIGLRPRIAERIQPAAQFLAAFPANLAFPVFVVAIVRLRLDADIWLSPLMILAPSGTSCSTSLRAPEPFPPTSGKPRTAFTSGDGGGGSR